MLIPESYVPDLNVRMALYRRLATIEDRAEMEGFAAELIDRFGPLPDEVKSLLEIVAIKHLCRVALVEKIEAGPKGATLSFRGGMFPNPAGLVRLITEHASTMKVRPDQKVVITRNWATPGRAHEGRPEPSRPFGQAGAGGVGFCPGERGQPCRYSSQALRVLSAAPSRATPAGGTCSPPCRAAKNRTRRSPRSAPRPSAARSTMSPPII